MQPISNYKNYLTLFVVAILIGEVLILNVIINFVSIDEGLVRYWFLLSSYIFIIIILFLEKDHLEEFHIDRFSIMLLIVFGSILHRKLLIPQEDIYIILLWVMSGVLLFFLIKNWKRLTHNNFYELFNAALITIIFVILLNYFENLFIAGPAIEDEKSAFLRTLRHLIFSLSFVAPPEEFLFRGLLWGILVRLGWREKKAIIFQGILFSLLHFRAGNAIRFFLLIPLTAIFFSILIIKYKRLFPAIMGHALINAILPYY